MKADAKDPPRAVEILRYYNKKHTVSSEVVMG